MTVPVPNVAAVKSYMGSAAATYSDLQYADALAAEAAAQARACRVTAYTADLANALCRRVHRNLAMRALPLGVVMDDAGGVRVGGLDGEIRRLERPYRRVVLG